MGLHDENSMHLYIVIYDVIHVITIELLNGSFYVVTTCKVYLYSSKYHSIQWLAIKVILKKDAHESTYHSNHVVGHQHKNCLPTSYVNIYVCRMNYDAFKN